MRDRVPSAIEYREAARVLYEEEGEIEIDFLEETEENPEDYIDRTDLDGEETGAYVQAWVWVPRSEAEKDNRL